MKLPIGMLRVVLWSATAGLLASTGWLLVAEFKEKGKRVERKVSFERTMAAELGKIRSSATGSFKSNDRRVLTETSLLGGVKFKPKEESRPAAVAEVKPVNPVEETVKVIAIRCFPDASESSVALAPKAAGVTITERLVFTVGETVPFAGDAVIKAIREREVVFELAGKTTVLRCSDQPPESGAAAATALKPGTIPSTLTEIATLIETKPGTGTTKIPRAAAAGLAAQGEKAFDGVRFSTTELEGGKTALQLDTPNPLMQQHGAQAGDILVSIDGYPMSSRGEVVDYVKRNPGKSRFEVMFLRKGAKLSRTIVVER